MRAVIVAVGWLGLVMSAARTLAEPPSTAYIFPAGAQRGTERVVRVGGHYLHDRAAWELAGKGLQTSPELVRTPTIWFEGPVIRQPASQRSEDYPQDYQATIQIAADAPLGDAWWRAWNAQGITAARRFVIGDLPEIVEEETDGQAIPVPVPWPVTINGRVFPREDVDLWTIHLAAGQRITAAVAAATLGSPLEARLEIQDATGRGLVESTGEAGADPLIHFTAPTAGDYRLAIHDVRYEGLQPFVYRLTVTDRPWIQHLYPLGGRRGTAVDFEVTGANLPSGTWRLELPATAPPALPWETRWIVPSGTSNPVTLALDDAPELLEREPNDGESEGVTVTWPSVANGRIGRAGDRDHWFVDVKKDQQLVCDLQAQRWGSPLDAVLTIHNAAGQELVRADDGPGGSPDPQAKIKFPSDGRYRITVSERFASRGGASFAYRLRITEPVPSVRLELTSDIVSVDRGAQQKLAVLVHRDGGFQAPVTLSVTGLPEGVTATDVVVAANQNRGELVVQATAAARIALSKLRVVGRAQLDGKPLEIVATATRRLPERPGEKVVERFTTAPQLDAVTLAVTLPTPFKFQGSYELTYIPCGAVSRKRYAVQRNGYQGPLEIRLADRQNRHLQGVTGPTITVPAGTDEFVYPITLPPWMELGRTSRVVLMATGELEDGHGGRHKVCFTSVEQNNQMVNLVSPSPLRITMERATMTAEPNRSQTLQIQLRRDPSIQGPVKLELIVPNHMRDVRGVAAEAPAGADQGVMRLEFGAQPGPLNAPVVVRATTSRGSDPLVAEAPLELVAP